MNLQENIIRIKEIMGLINEDEQSNLEKKENILYPLSTGGDKTLILLPGSGNNGGQGDNDFTTLTNNLGKDFSIYTANFDNEFDVRKYANDIVEEIKNNPNINSFAVGGFSIGGAMAWHLARILKDENVEKFNNQLFFIDSGIPDSTDEFIENMIDINIPRIAIAQPLDIFIKNRNGESITPQEEEQILKFYTIEELNTFKNGEGVKGNYIEYVGSDFPPSTEEIQRELGDNNPWIIEDKYDTTNFETRYSNKAPDVKGQTFEIGDTIDYRYFAEKDTRPKQGLGRELPDGGTIGALDGVEVISLFAAKKKEGDKTPEELELEVKNAEKATSNASSQAIGINALHGDITQSKELATEISRLYK